MAVPDMKQPDACSLAQPWYYDDYEGVGYGAVEVYNQDYEVDEDPKPRRRGGRRRKKQCGSLGDLAASPVKAQRADVGLRFSPGGPARGLLAAFRGCDRGAAAGGHRGAAF